MAFENVITSPGDIIIRKGEVGTELFFVYKGQLEVLGDDRAILATKKSGEYFGEVALVLNGMRRTAAVRAKSYCILAKLEKQKFEQAMKNEASQLAEMLDTIRSFHNIPLTGLAGADYAPKPPPRPSLARSSGISQASVE